MNPVYDIAIIGGGINGAGIAADAAGRGHRVYLCEADDFAAATSWASSKLIHGGLRYLEHYEFRLVREALAERVTLLKKAPHLIKPMRFILPHRPHLRPAWMIRSGLFLYDNLAGRKQLERSKGYKLNPESTPLKEDMHQVFEYSDCTVDDARLVISNLISACENGAQIENYTRCTRAKIEGDYWQIEVHNSINNTSKIIKAKSLVNASGPWAQEFIEHQLKTESSRTIRHIKGSHLILPKQDIGEKAFILQNEDNRIVFVIPYLNEYTLVGTTDKAYQGDLRTITIDDEERDYLLKVYNDHFKDPIHESDIVCSYSGVRPLCDDESDDPSAITRDYTLDLVAEDNAPPLLNIFGGKITTYRRLAEAAMDKLLNHITPLKPRWTEQASLPGGDDWAGFSEEAREKYSWLSEAHLERYLNQYGNRTALLLRGCHTLEDLGEHFGADLYAKEVNYLVDHEWVTKARNLLFIRTKLYLKGDAIDVLRLDNHIKLRLIENSSEQHTA